MPADISASNPTAVRLVRRALTGPSEELTPAWAAEELSVIPSGTARQCVMQCLALAALAVRRLSVVEGDDPDAVLDELLTQAAAPTEAYWGEDA